MNDFLGRLPLSQGRSGDESTVVTDWRPLIGESLRLVAGVLAHLSDEEWQRSTGRDHWRVQDVAGHLAICVRSNPAARAAAVARTVVQRGMSPAIADLELARTEGDVGRHALVRRLQDAADQSGNRRRTGSIGELGLVIADGYEIGRGLGIPVDFPPVATGAVALARVLSAPTPIRAAVRNRALTATDAGWSVGYGDVLAAPADAIILFLYGRSESMPS